MQLAPLTPLTLRDNSSDPITLAMVGYRVPGYDDPDYYASEILNDVLNSPRGALYELQASGKSLGTLAQSSTHPAAGLSIVGSAVPVTTTGDTAVTEVKAVIDGYKQTGLPPDLVAVAKARELAQAQSASNSINGLASLWSQELAVEHRTPGRRAGRSRTRDRRRRQPRAAQVLRQRDGNGRHRDAESGRGLGLRRP